jgi:hypothetical protein
VTERVITWTDRETGVACKGRIDAISPDAVVDLKGTRDLGRFTIDAARLEYHGQSAFYRDGAYEADIVKPGVASYIVAVETAPPYDVGVFLLPSEVIEEGRSLYRSYLELWQQCSRTDTWPGLYPVPTELELPAWAWSGEDGEI